jgi:hypothetical protein
LIFSQDVDCFITLDGPSGRLEIAESLLGVHAPLDGSVILFQDIVQVLHGPVPISTAKCPFLLHLRDGGAVDRCKVRIEDAWLRMRRILESLTKQAFGRVGVTQN